MSVEQFVISCKFEDLVPGLKITCMAIAGQITDVHESFFVDIFGVIDNTLTRIKTAHNSVSFRFNSNDNINYSFKLFKNGYFIISGNKLRENILQNITKLKELSGGQISYLKIRSINTTMQNIKKLNLMETYEILCKSNVKCSYNVHLSPGIHISHTNLSTNAIIFKQTTFAFGHKTIQQCNDTYNYVFNLLFDDKYNIFTNDSVELKL